MGESLTRMENDVADMKRFMALGDDVDMIIDDTRPNYPRDSPPPLSYPPPRNPSPVHGSHPQFDAAKKGGNSQQSPK